MWNELNIENPSYDLCEYGTKDAIILEDLPSFVTLLTSAAEILTKEHPIWDEIQVFKNIQMKYKKILHCDKCLQKLQRVGVCLRKMVLLQLSKAYLSLGEKILKELENPNRRSSFFLPSRQQFEFVLIRTQTAAKLICECLHYSREAFCHLIQRLKVGHLILNLMMAASVTARLNIVFKAILIQICDAYKKLYKWRQRLKIGCMEWPKPLDLPEDLEAWINLKDSEYMKPNHLPKEGLDFLTSIFAENGEVHGPDLEDDDVILVNAIESRAEDLELDAGAECIILDDMNYDNGVPIERSEIENDESDSSSEIAENNMPTKDNEVSNLSVELAEDHENEESNLLNEMTNHEELVYEIEDSDSANEETLHENNLLEVEDEESVISDTEMNIQHKETRKLNTSTSRKGTKKRKSMETISASTCHPSTRKIDAPTSSIKLNERFEKAVSDSKSNTKHQENIKTIPAQKLTRQQKKLLEKIKEAEDFKQLKAIWDNLDRTSQVLLPKGLTPAKIRVIDKLFLKLKRQIAQLNSSNVACSVEEKKKEIKLLMKIARLKLAKRLKLLQNNEENTMKEKGIKETELKPVKSLKGLKELYQMLYHRSQVSQDYQKCRKLKKAFKSRKADILLLIQNGESAKNLIFNTSKILLCKFQ